MPGPRIYGAGSARASGAFSRSAARRYAFAVGIALAEVCVRWLLAPLLGEAALWIFLFPAVLVSALYGRFSAGVVSTVLALVLTYFCWRHTSTWVAGGLELRASIGVLAGALLICWAAERSNCARRDLEFQRRFLDSVLSSFTDGLVVLDGEWRYIYVNEAAVKIARKPREELLGRVVWELFPQIRNTVFETELKRSRREKAPVRFEMVFPEANLWYEFRAHPMDGSSAVYVADISARKQTEMELKEAKDILTQHALGLEQAVRERTATLEKTVGELEESVAELEQFSYTISHDLRAPLRAMQSFATFIGEEYGNRLDATGLDYLDRIQSAAQRMDRLINDVLIYTRASRAEAAIVSIDLDKLVEAIVTQYAPASGGQIEVRHPLGRVRGNEALLTQVISNLVVNAVKFVRAGEAPEVTIWGEATDGRRRLSVRDRGIGIPANARDKIFGLFERAHGHEYAGTGIGLAIVKRAMERMGGRVDFRSEVGKGSTFWIELEAEEEKAEKAA